MVVAIQAPTRRNAGFALLAVGALTLLATLTWPTPHDDTVSLASSTETTPTPAETVATVIQARIIPLGLGAALVASGIAMLAWGRRTPTAKP